MESRTTYDVAVIGAGPAGLTAAYRLSRQGRSVVVLEADPTSVGGIARTSVYKGFRFDVGGHRFFSKSRAVEDFWTEILPDDMLVRPRSSRIYYRGKYFSYPLRALEAFWKLGPVEAGLCVLSYLRARLVPVASPGNFEEWVTNQFGERLYRIFFKTYTEKVWGIDCTAISADWAAQRIRSLSLGRAIREALLPTGRTGSDPEVIQTLITTFRYPRLGPGMLWEACAERTRALGGRIVLGRRVTGLERDEASGEWRVEHAGVQQDRQEVRARHLVSSAPLRDLAGMLAPRLTEAAQRAGARLRYRDFLTVAVILRDRGAFPDNWIYIHDPKLRVGRIQNYKSWSPEMVPDPGMCCYGLEYFCFEGDEVWNAPDRDLLALAGRELAALGLAGEGDVLDGCVVRQAKAYPVYDEGYAESLAALRTELEARFPTLHVVGRNGMHRYNNQDHAIMTAMLCTENILAGRRVYDVWKVNEDAIYLEAGPTGGADGNREGR